MSSTEVLVPLNLLPLFNSVANEDDDMPSLEQQTSMLRLRRQQGCEDMPVPMDLSDDDD